MRINFGLPVGVDERFRALLQDQLRRSITNYYFSAYTFMSGIMIIIKQNAHNNLKITDFFMCKNCSHIHTSG